MHIHSHILCILGIVKDEQEKKIFLTAWLEGKVKKTQETRLDISHHGYDFCMLLHECGDGVNDIIKENLRYFNFFKKDLQVEDVSVVSSVMSRSSMIDGARFREVRLDNENIKPFADCLKKCSLVEVMFLRHSENLFYYYLHQVFSVVRYLISVCKPFFLKFCSCFS